LRPVRAEGFGVVLKRVIWILISLFLHPVAVVLMLLNVAGRQDLNPSQKIIWALVGLIWGLGPTLYVLVGGGALW
jgi:hypothetical protein